MKTLFSFIILLSSFSAFSADHAGLDTTLKCIQSEREGYDLVKELSAIYINRVSNTKNIYYSSKVSESILVEGLDLDTCLGAVTDVEAKKI